MRYSMLDHPWIGDLRIVNGDYLRRLGVDLCGIKAEVLKTLEEASCQAIIDYTEIGGRPPLLRHGRKLNVTTASIPDDLALEKHCNCSECPVYIREVVPCKSGCQINCQYCAIISNMSIQTGVTLYENYAEWFRTQLACNRVQDHNQHGKLYYWSAKTEALSPEMVEMGIAQKILLAFEDHVEEEKRRLRGRCPDTLLIITKAGWQELVTPDTEGNTVLNLIRRVADNVQVCGSVSFLNGNSRLREALEPGARSETDRFEFLKLLQRNGILATGLLLQPIYPSFLPGDDYYRMLKDEIGIERMHADILTSNIRALSVVLQIIGWYYPDAERSLWELYLPQDAPEKSNRKSIGPEKQREIINSVMAASKQAGINTFHYCRFTQKAAGLIPRPEEECMAYVTPTPERIRELRTEAPAESATLARSGMRTAAVS